METRESDFYQNFTDIFLWLQNSYGTQKLLCRNVFLCSWLRCDGQFKNWLPTALQQIWLAAPKVDIKLKKPNVLPR